MIPAGFVQPNARMMLPAGSLIDVDILRREVEATGVSRDRLLVDGGAGILERSDIDGERDDNLWDQFGSTQSGVGHALARRIMRRSDFRLAKDVPELSEIATVGDVSNEVNDVVRRGGYVIIEGTQGYGLSIYHTAQFPFATSRDTTAASFLSEVGVAPNLVDQVVMAVRTYPIRVAGNSGPLPNEITWGDVQQQSGSPEPITERTTTTKRIRRVAEFDLGIVRRAAAVNGATSIALHGGDYLDYSSRGVTEPAELSGSIRRFVDQLQGDLSVRVDLVGTGPETEQFADFTRARQSRRTPVGSVRNNEGGDA